MEIGWTDVGSRGYILVSCAHSNTSYRSVFIIAVDTDGHGETNIPPYNFVEGGIINIFFTMFVALKSSVISNLKEKYTTTILKSKRKIATRGKTDTLNTHICDHLTHIYVTP
jgi:hypothetical protein